MNTGKKFTNKTVVSLVFLIALALVPVFGDTFTIRMAGRILIYGLCALSLDLILGYGGMVSFGHAAFFGIGAYTTAILSHHGLMSAWILWPFAVGASALAALFVGAISLRTKGVYFIMITLAFAQMFFYFFSGLDAYGGDDGLALFSRNRVAGFLDPNDPVVFYYILLLILTVVYYLFQRLVQSRFGMVIAGARENERRMRALGFPIFRYRLTCFVIAGAIAGLSGALIANQNNYVSPILMHWTRSGDILVMVILGGMGTLIGPVIGAAVLLVVEEILSGYTEHWMIILGPLLIVVVLFAKGGVYRIFSFREPG